MSGGTAGNSLYWMTCPAYVWDGENGRAVSRIEAPPLDLLRAIEPQKRRIVTNIDRHAQGHAAHDMLLWGSRGMGKSALLRAAVADCQLRWPESLALVQLPADRIDSLPHLFAVLRDIERRFIVFLDDLGFAPGDLSGPRHLRSLLEGGVEARPGTIRLAVTSNRRSVIPRDADTVEGARHLRDMRDDELALADRFGLSIGFHDCSEAEYLAIIEGYAKHYRLDWQGRDALQWARQRGARSGRVAWQYIIEIAGEAGRVIE